MLNSNLVIKVLRCLMCAIFTRHTYHLLFRISKKEQSDWYAKAQSIVANEDAANKFDSVEEWYLASMVPICDKTCIGKCAKCVAEHHSTIVSKP